MLNRQVAKIGFLLKGYYKGSVRVSIRVFLGFRVIYSCLNNYLYDFGGSLLQLWYNGPQKVAKIG